MPGWSNVDRFSTRSSTKLAQVGLRSENNSRAWDAKRDAGGHRTSVTRRGDRGPSSSICDESYAAIPFRCAIRSVIEHLPRSSHGTRWMRRPGGVSRGCGGAREVPMGPNVPPRASRARLPFSTAGVEGVRPAWPRGAQWFGLASSAQKAGQSLTDWHENI